MVATVKKIPPAGLSMVTRNGGMSPMWYEFFRQLATATIENSSSVDHDATTNFVANEHIDWTSATTTFSTTENIIVGGTVDGRDVATDGIKLDTVETSADVTDAANVTAALNGASISTATVNASDKVLIQDVDDTDNLKTVTATSIAALAASLSGTAKGWINYDSSSAAITASFNVTSVTDEDVGDSTIVWATDFSGADDYTIVGMAENDNSVIALYVTAGGRAAGTSRVKSVTDAGAAADTSGQFVVAFGSQ